MLLEARHDLDKIVRALGNALTTSLCDGYAIQFAPGTRLGVVAHRDDRRDATLVAIETVADRGNHVFETSAQALTVLPATYADYVHRFGLRGLAIVPLTGALVHGTVTVTRDRTPFDDDDLAAIVTCVEYAGMAADTALALRREREQTSQFQDEMLGIVGHDLQGPLGAIIIGTEMLARDGKDGATEPAVARIGLFARRMARMVDQLLDLTRARIGGGIPLARRTTRLLPLVKSALAAAELAYPDHRFALGEAADATGIWDPERLAQLTSYLLANAAHHGRQGARITIGIADGIGAARIAVHHELRGESPIPTELLATLFEPRRHHGCGLDLYLVHEIVRAHGGRITVESSGAGTTFQLVVPKI